MPFLTISNENIFLKTQGTRLGAIVAPNKGLEWALIKYVSTHYLYRIFYFFLSFQEYKIYEISLIFWLFKGKSEIPGVFLMNSWRVLELTLSPGAAFHIFYPKYRSLTLNFQISLALVRNPIVNENCNAHCSF